MTEVPLRDYIDERLTALAESLNHRLSAYDRAVDKAVDAARVAQEKSDHANERRFESVNEFRASLDDNARLMMPRNEAEQRFTNIDKGLAALEKQIAKIENLRAGRTDLWGWIFGASGIIIGIVTVLWRQAV